jgi:apolipoprotein N-acyltransferase
LKRWLELGAAAMLSALAFALYARVGWPWIILGTVWLVPWLAVLDRAVSLRDAVIAGLAMAVAFVLLGFGWFAPAIVDYSGAPLAVALLLLAVAAPLLEPQLLAFAVARHLARRRSSDRAAAFVAACVYVVTEWIAPKFFGDTLGQGLYASVWLRQGADLAGVHGLTLVLLLVNECLLASGYALMQLRRGAGGARDVLRPSASAALLLLMLAAYGALRVRQLAPSDEADRVTVGVVQANLSHYDRMRAELGTYATVRTILDTHFALSRQALARAKLDLLVWPETVYPTTFGSPKSETGAELDREIAAFVADSGVPLAFGTYDREGEAEFNAAVFLTPRAAARLAAHDPTSVADAPDRRSFATYHKIWLFPLTEYVPRLLDRPWLRARLPWLGTWKRGSGPATIALTLADGRQLGVVPLICYDALDPPHVLAAVRRGADLIVTLSNDSWFAHGAGPWLHLVGAAFLSIETRRPQVRATNTGMSAIITATGEIVEGAGVGEVATLVAPVAPERRGALRLMLGDWLGPAALACALAVPATSGLRRRRVRGARRGART